jgi:hypothetical protein
VEDLSLGIEAEQAHSLGADPQHPVPRFEEGKDPITIEARRICLFGTVVDELMAVISIASMIDCVMREGATKTQRRLISVPTNGQANGGSDAEETSSSTGKGIEKVGQVGPSINAVDLPGIA